MHGKKIIIVIMIITITIPGTASPLMLCIGFETDNSLWHLKGESDILRPPLVFHQDPFSSTGLILSVKLMKLENSKIKQEFKLNY